LVDDKVNNKYSLFDNGKAYISSESKNVVDDMPKKTSVEGSVLNFHASTNFNNQISKNGSIKSSDKQNNNLQSRFLIIGHDSHRTHHVECNGDNDNHKQ